MKEIKSLRFWTPRIVIGWPRIVFFASEKEYRRADREAPNAIVMGRAYAAFELDRGSVLHAATDLLEAVREWGEE